MPRYATATNRRSFNIQARALENHETNTLVGLAKLDVRVRPTTRGELKGIFLPFTLDSEGNLNIYHGETFFHGSQEHLEMNYFKEIPTELLEPKFVAIPGDRMDKRYSIPLDQMQLEGARKELAEEIQRDPQKIIEASIDSLVEMETEGRDPRSLRSHFRGFPRELKLEAIKKGSFFRNQTQRNEIVYGKTYVVGKNQIPRIFYTPTGGLPDWARAKWKRRH